MPPFIYKACMCCVSGCDFDNITIGCKSEGDCLCLTGERCLAIDEEMIPFGVMTAQPGEVCKLGLGICSCGIKVPSSLCDHWHRCLCFYSAASFPCGEQNYLDAPHCACCFLSCAPKCGCVQPPSKEIPVKLSHNGYGAPDIDGMAR